MGGSHFRLDAAKARRKVERIQQFLPKGSTILDVGCGPGFFVAESRKEGFIVMGCDIAQVAAEYAKRELHIEIQTGAFTKISFKEQFFDAVTMFSCLEHTLSPEDNLEKARKLLRPKGLLALSIPNAWGIGRYIKGYHWRGFSFPEHLHFWGKQEMVALLQNNGFTNIQTPFKDNNFFRDTIYYYAWKI